MTEILEELSQLLGRNVRKSIEDGKRAFDELGARIKTEVEPVIPDIKEVIRKTGRELEKVANSLTSAIGSIPVAESRESISEFVEPINEYAPYRWALVL